MKKIFQIPKAIAMILLRTYQFLFSFDHSFWSSYVNYRVCIYHPSCSEYTYQAINKFGLIKGSWLGIKRIIKCSPGNIGGADPIPE